MMIHNSAPSQSILFLLSRSYYKLHLRVQSITENIFFYISFILTEMYEKGVLRIF